ncbi:MAG: MTAP family purine nucleoside phosphorylase, partial [Candidatus Kariarchaeaceae archaeon]
MIGIIGGSGFYNFTENMEMKTIDTPFGSVTYEIGTIKGKTVFFIPRHGKKHSVAPNQINYRANIFAAHKLKAKAILATNAVGSIRGNIPPGTFVTPDDIMDFTSGRSYTFFDGNDLVVTTHTGKQLNGVVHVDVSDVFDPHLRQLIGKACSKLGKSIQDGGTIVITNGPRFESPAEIKAYGILGGDFVGMTSSPEVFLAKELEIPYST